MLDEIFKRIFLILMILFEIKINIPQINSRITIAFHFVT